MAEAHNTPPRDTACMRRCELNIVVGAVAGSQFKMACFTRSVVWRFWTAVLLLSDMLLHLVRAGTLEQHSAYQACVASPATCRQLCVFPLSLEGVLELATTPRKRIRDDGENWES
jgi:hypothetical protein